ncbi:MAG: hypothetical protein AAGH89_03275 [Verrucomicrobiota bacterium]
MNIADETTVLEDAPPRSYTPDLGEYMAFQLQKLQAAHQSGKMTDEAFAKERLLIISKYPEVSGEIAKEHAGANVVSVSSNLKARQGKQNRITGIRYLSFAILLAGYVGGFYFLGLSNSRYAEMIHWDRTLVAVIGAFAVAFLAGTTHLTLNEWYKPKTFGHYIFLGVVVLFAALNQGILFNPWDPALEQIDQKFEKPTFLSHIGVVVVTLSTLVLSGFAVAAGFLSSGFSTLPKILVGFFSSGR